MKNIKKIKAVEVYLEKKKTREYVGRITYDGSNFIFMYDKRYIYSSRPISLGPDLPLSPKKFVSKAIFPSFLDRIPSQENPAYKEYCKMVGISSAEKNILVLLSTLGKKGPSSFIFTPVFEEEFDKGNILNFRKDLKLSVREFSAIFDFSPRTINKIEKNTATGKEALKRLEIYYKFPEIALYEIEKNGDKINERKKLYAEKVLREALAIQTAFQHSK